jgi:hypothetical protein
LFGHFPRFFIFTAQNCKLFSSTHVIEKMTNNKKGENGGGMENAQ